jgi:hypothetical protein
MKEYAEAAVALGKVWKLVQGLLARVRTLKGRPNDQDVLKALVDNTTSVTEVLSGIVENSRQIVESGRHMSENHTEFAREIMRVVREGFAEHLRRLEALERRVKAPPGAALRSCEGHVSNSHDFLGASHTR